MSRPHVERHRVHQPAVFTFDHRRSFDDRDGGQAAERDPLLTAQRVLRRASVCGGTQQSCRREHRVGIASCWIRRHRTGSRSAVRRHAARGRGHRTGSHQQLADGLFVFAVDAGVANANREAFAFFNGVGDDSSGQRDFNLVLNVLDRNAVPRSRLAVDVDLQIALAHDRRGERVACSGNRLERGFNLFADPINRVEVRAKDLHANVGADAGREHLDAIDDRLCEDVRPTGHLQHAAHFVLHEITLRASRPWPEEEALSEGDIEFFTQPHEHDCSGPPPFGRGTASVFELARPS